MKDVLGKIDTADGPRLLVDRGHSGPAILVEGLARLGASHQLVRLDLFADDARLVEGQQSAEIVARLAMPLDAFLSFADTLALHADGIRKALGSNQSPAVAPPEPGDPRPPIGERIA